MIVGGALDVAPSVDGDRDLADLELLDLARAGLMRMSSAPKRTRSVSKGM